MQIRKAEILDINNIKEIADSLAVKPDELHKKSGFYDYSLTKIQYFDRITSPFFFVIENQRGLEGFCMAYNINFVKRLREQKPQLKEDAIFDYLNNMNKNCVYIDQLAVKEPKTITGSFVAYNLMKNMINEAKENEIHSLLGAIAHKPWKNISAINFAKKFDFELQKEINSKNIILGLYRLDF